MSTVTYDLSQDRIMTITMKCPVCEKHVEVHSRSVGLKHHIQDYHPEEWAKMQANTRKGNKQSLGWRCLKCNCEFHEVPAYREHYEDKHGPKSA